MKPEDAQLQAFLQSDVFRQLATDKVAQEALKNNDFQRALADASVRVALSSPDVVAAIAASAAIAGAPQALEANNARLAAARQSSRRCSRPARRCVWPSPHRSWRRPLRILRSGSLSQTLTPRLPSRSKSPSTPCLPPPRQSQCDGSLVAGHGRRRHKCCRKRGPLTITIYRPALTSIKPEARSNASRFRLVFAGASPRLP